MENALFLKIENSFKNFSRKDFVLLRMADGQQIQKTYFEFEKDVFSLSSYFVTLQSKNLVTINGNNYVHLVQILSALKSGKTLTLISPEDHPNQQKQKLSKLSSDSVVLDNALCSQKMNQQVRAHNSILNPAPYPGETAIQVFTSGSTGYSKVVCLSYDNINSNIQAVVDHHHLGGQETIATSLPIFHVNCLFFSFLSSFVSGCKLILFERFEFSSFTEVIAKESATIVSVVPTLINILCRSSKWIDSSDFRSVKYFVSAASYLSPELMKLFSNTFGKKIIQGYGLSEIVNFSLTMPISVLQDEDKYWKIAVDQTNTCAGKALFDNEVRVFDDQFNACSENQIGQICIRGSSVMKHYRDDQQRSSFYKDFFCTGDLGYFREIDSVQYFYISGRKKDIIKRNGVTVSLKEVDDQLLNLNIGQKDVISVGFESEIYGEDIGLVLEVDPDFQIEKKIDELKEYLTIHFSSHARPKVVLLTNAKARTPSGKPTRHSFRAKFQNLKSFDQGNLIVINELS